MLENILQSVTLAICFIFTLQRYKKVLKYASKLTFLTQKKLHPSSQTNAIRKEIKLKIECTLYLL